jgi:hypothetical protein
MYVWIWRHLPGPLLARAAQSLVLLALVVAALFVWVFPEVESRLPYQDVTVPVGPSATPAPTAVPTPTLAPAPGTTITPTPLP